MDVKFEDANVDRHLDLTTSNHASYPGSTGPMSAQELVALERIAEDMCPCCEKSPMHANQRGEAVSEEEWYDTNEFIPDDPPEPDYAIIHPGPPETIWPNPAHETWQAQCAELAERRQLRNNRQRRVAAAKKCPSSPEPPCNVYFRIPSAEQAELAEEEWRTVSNDYKDRHNMQLVPATSKDRKGHKIPRRGDVAHKTPITAGGCPVAEANLKEKAAMTKKCQENDDALGIVQEQCATQWRRNAGMA
jgi:hypothetical protein